MITIRKAAERGHENHGWLDTWHTFSFASYYDPQFMGFRDLRIINEDRVAPGKGFGRHPHDNMEILTYVLEGQLEHRDSMGNGSIVCAGKLQGMSAGRGVEHSESNPSKAEPVHFLQIWILPDRQELEPSYSDWAPPKNLPMNAPRLIASPRGGEGCGRIHQDVSIHLLPLAAGGKARMPLSQQRYAWVQVTRGRLSLNGQELAAGDGAAVSGETSLDFKGGTANAEALVFDLA